MDTVTQYKGYYIVPVCSTKSPYAAQYQITADPLSEGRHIMHGWLPNTFASEKEAFKAALDAGKERVDTLAPRR